MPQHTASNPVLDTIAARFDEMAEVLRQFSVPENFTKIDAAATLLVNSFTAGGKVIACGNGGSLADALHFAEELTGRFRNNRRALPALAITDPGHISCVANDYGYDAVFSRFIEAHGKAGDVLLAISTSGNSPNVIQAAQSAQALGMAVIGLTGKDGGKLAPLCTVELRVPHHGYADRVQEIHIKIIHTLIEETERRLGLA